MAALMAILPTPTIFGLIVVSCANTNAAGPAIKETPFQRERLYELARPPLNVEISASKLCSIVLWIFIHMLQL